jgi:plasmid stabilization system protein ParE
MKVYWTKFALNSLSEVYKYYKINVSITIANNIRQGILSSTNQLEKHTLSGQIEENLLNLGKGHRYIIRGNYKIIYNIQNQKVYVTDVFDTRQNPDKITYRSK